MRLTKHEIESIKKAFQETFENGKIYLFGSRVDDTKRGGDIDVALDINLQRDDFRRKKQVSSHR